MLKGLDTSHHNDLNAPLLRNIAWRNRLYFNFMKATEGVTFQDHKFLNYWEYSQDAGLLCSGYHFLRPLSDAEGQAYNFLAQYTQVNLYGALPPVVDIEWVESDGKEQWEMVDPIARIKHIKKFLKVVEAAIKTKPIIYTANYFWKEYIVPFCTPEDNAFFREMPAWIVNLYGRNEVPRPWMKAILWQTHFGEHGASHNPYEILDHNTFNDTLKGLLNMTLPGYTLSEGDPRSWIVFDLQEALLFKGFIDAEPDGWFGPITEKAVRKFQKAHNLIINGIVDRNVWNRLLP